MKRKGWFWLLFLILLMSLLAVLAARYNVISFRTNQALVEPVLGTIGFLVTMAGLVLFFVRLAQEMRLNLLQSEFLAAVTHELKTPIATLELSSTLLKDPGNLSRAELDRLWTSHQEELRRLSQEVDLLLEAARWDAKAIKLRRLEVNLQEWIQAQTPRWKKILGESNELRMEGDPLPVQVLADLRVLNLVAENLVENARKFAKDRARLVIRTRREEKRWVIEFRDEGWGFEPGDAKKIFRRFYRSRAFAPYSIPGSGLGLFLAKSAAGRMGMKLSAASEGSGKGAIFTLSGKARGGARA